jgi:hypothetical protein
VELILVELKISLMNFPGVPQDSTAKQLHLQLTHSILHLLCMEVAEQVHIVLVWIPMVILLTKFLALMALSPTRKEPFLWITA